MLEDTKMTAYKNDWGQGEMQQQLKGTARWSS